MQGCIHYRVVPDTVGPSRNLATFQSSREFLIATLDAMEAHAHAYKFADILHRDISPGNVMITSEGRGFLIDWDHATRKDVNDDSARALRRTGTWQFMSGALLQNPTTKSHEFSDDLESFLHMLTYILIRFSESTWDAHYIREHITYMYEDCVPRIDSEKGKSYYAGGRYKISELGGRAYIARNLQFLGRDGLSPGLARISWGFAGIYQESWEDDGEALKRKASLWLNGVDQGGKVFRDQLRELIQKADEWADDAPAKPIKLSDQRDAKEPKANICVVKLDYGGGV